MIKDLFRAPRSDDGIPVLTEVVKEPAASDAAFTSLPGPEAKTSSSKPEATAHRANSAAGVAFGVPPVMEREIGAPLTITPLVAANTRPNTASAPDQLSENQLRDAVLSRVLTRINPVLEHRLNETTREVLEQVLPLLREELQNALSVTAKDVISRAITQEVARLLGAQKKVQ